MLLSSLNLVFALIFGGFSWRAMPRGLRFLRLGWTLIQAGTARPDYRENVESRRDISTGGTYVIGGLLWCGASAGSAVMALVFTGRAFGLGI